MRPANHRGGWGGGCLLAGGDSYGASLAASQSSGANQSGATSGGDSNNFGVSYGPGSLVEPINGTGSSGVSISTPVILALAAAAAFVLYLIFGKR